LVCDSLPLHSFSDCSPFPSEITMNPVRLHATDRPASRVPLARLVALLAALACPIPATVIAQVASGLEIQPIGNRMHTESHADPASLTPTSVAPQDNAAVFERARAQSLAPDRHARPAGLARTPTILTTPNGLAGFGYSVSAVGDVDGDGYADFVVTTSGSGSSGYGAYLYAGGPNGPGAPVWSYEKLILPMKVAAAGDVNGDGYDDLLFGYGDASGGGRVEIRYGHPSGPNKNADLTVEGYSLGFSVQTAGDVNGDGYADIIVGAPFDTPPHANIYFGSVHGLSVSNSQVLYEEFPASDRFGYSVAGVGDLNGDGYGDVAIGAPDSYNSAGAVFVGFGTKESVELPPGGYVSFVGSEDWGAVVAPAGDVDGDGYADILVTDPNGSFDGGTTESGWAEVLKGGPGPLGTIEFFAQGSASTSEHLGVDAFTAGDINGDGLADVLVASPNGTVHVVESVFDIGTLDLGPSAPGIQARAAGDVNSDGFGDVLVATPGTGQVRFYKGVADPPGAQPTVLGGPQAYGQAGWSVAMGDVNGDGYDDLVVGVPNLQGAAGVNCGAVTLYLGGPNGVPSTPSWVGEGFVPNGQLGISVAAGQDANGDGFGDIFAGAYIANQAVLIYGRQDWSATTIDQGWIYTGPPDSNTGSSVAFAGDVNGDGFADELVGAPQYTDPFAPGTPQIGKATLILGATHVAAVSAWAPGGAPQANAQEGWSVAGAGDVNGDGYSDVVIGAPYYDDLALSHTDAGHARLYLGGPAGLSNTATREWVGADSQALLGGSVAGIGDFDRDGFGDVAFGATGTGGGTAYVARGNASGAEATPTWSFVDTPGGAFGNAVAGAGDVDGDGSSDLLVGEAFYSDGSFFPYQGRMQVFPGGALAGHSSIATWQGPGFSYLGNSVAGGGDLNGDGYADVAGGEPGLSMNFINAGGVTIGMGNAARGVYTEMGHPRPTHLGRANYPGYPLGLYGTSNAPTQVGIESWTSSPGGRDRVALEWRVDPIPGASGASAGRSAWTPMAAPTNALGGAVAIDAAPAGLNAASAYAVKVRQLSRSPYFRYGAWLEPQANARGQWDFRTRASATGVTPIAASPGSLELAAPWPSPARDQVHVALSLPRGGDTRVSVRDLQGRLVRTLASGELTAGRHELTWDGRDAHGQTCAAGLYFVELVAGGERYSQRVVRVR
jgi:FlgD Ig-like domain/FG-GAP-like repeat/FG-GAP repeat